MSAHPVGVMPQISPQELARLLAEKDKAPCARGVEEFEDDLGHIPGSLLIPLNQLSWRKDEIPATVPSPPSAEQEAAPP